MDVGTVAVFGGSGKLGRRVVRFLVERGFAVRALQHTTSMRAEGVATVEGSVCDPQVVRQVVSGADIVVQMATTKEAPDTFFDVSVRGTLNVLEACRHETVKQFLLVGGDAAFGIWFYPQPVPIDESHLLTAYPGYYAFTKVLEEVMTEQYRIQYGLPTTILRSSWIFERDDLLSHFSLLRNVDPAEPGHGFGEVSEDVLALVRAGEERVPILTNEAGVPYHRHIVHIEDVLQAFGLMLANPSALGHSFNIAAPAPFDYRVAAAYLSECTGLPTVEIACPGYHSFCMNINKARAMLGYSPLYDFRAMADSAVEYARSHG